MFQVPSFAADNTGAPEIYKPSEKKIITSSKSLNDRIKVYDKVFERLRKEIEKDIHEERFDAALRKSYGWLALLKESRADIEANSNPKKKSGKLRKYEIHLRQSVHGLRGFRAYLPEELRNSLDRFVEQAEEARHKFMDIIFHIN